jgi:glycerol kinase
MASPLILAIDQGTTSTRALIFDQIGQIQAKAQKDLAVFTPQSGWVEQDANQIWEDVKDVCKKALAQVNSDDVIGIGITNQRETTILWDKKTGEPIYHAIVWQDRRTSEFCETLKPHADKVQEKTGLIIDPYFSATKIKWILEQTGVNPDDILFGTIDSFLLWNLTGGKVHATDASNAARTMIFNIHDQEWDKDLCDILGVPTGILPNVMDNMAEFGTTDLFGKSLPILSMVGDQQAATFGQSCFEKGMVKSTYGTGCFVLMNTGDDCVTSKHRLLSTVAWRINGEVTYALEGSIFVAGAAIQFLRDNLKFFQNAMETDQLARSVNDTGGVVFVPSFVGLGAPHWNPDVRGAIMGISRGTTQAHITRAVLDAQAYQTKDLLDAFAADAGHDIDVIRVDGGLVNNDYVCQTIADVTCASVDRPTNTEATVWGAAAMAFMQAGVFTSFGDIVTNYSLDRTYEPSPDRSDLDHTRWKHAIKSIQIFSS